MSCMCPFGRGGLRAYKGSCTATSLQPVNANAHTEEGHTEYRGDSSRGTACSHSWKRLSLKGGRLVIFRSVVLNLHLVNEQV